METFTWLHFSDIHWGAKKTEQHWGNIVEELFKDIASLKAKHHLDYDIIFFTGDLVNKGKEYSKFNDCLRGVRNELHAINSDPILLTVPGNHDLERPDKDDDRYKIFCSDWEDDENLRNRIWEKKEKSQTWQLIREAFSNYEKWRKNAKRPLAQTGGIKDGLLPGDFSYTFKKKTGDFSIGIIGLNTAFRHLGDKSKGKIEVHPAQLFALCGKNYHTWFKNHTLSFLLTHHPLTWFSKNGKKAYVNEIAREGRFVLHLCGHMHENEFTDWQNGFHSESRKILQGISLFSMEEYTYWDNNKEYQKTDRRHGYSAGQLEFKSDHIVMRIWPRTVNKSLKFVQDTDLCPDREYAEIIIPYKKPGKKKSKGKPDSDIAKIVIDNISEILKKNGLQFFKECMYKTIKEEESKEVNNEKEIVDVFTGKGPLHSLPVISLALDKYKKKEKTALIWEDVVSIVGWLLLLSVDTSWIKSNNLIFDDEENSIRIELPLKTAVGVEIIVSGLEKKGTKLTIDKTGNIIRGARNISYCLEDGPLTEDKVNSWKKAVYKHLNKEDPPDDYIINFKTKYKNDLNERLKFYNAKRHHHYIVLDNDMMMPDSQKRELLRQLQQELPALNTVILTIGDNQSILLHSEVALNAWLSEFFKSNLRGN